MNAFCNMMYYILIIGILYFEYKEIHTAKFRGSGEIVVEDYANAGSKFAFKTITASYVNNR